MFPALIPFIALAQDRSAPRESPIYSEPLQTAPEFPQPQSQYQPQSFLPLLAGAGAVASRVLPIAVQGAQMLYNRYSRSDPDDEDDFDDEEEDFE